ncbi:glycosyl transferase, partial [bacterium]|nr:glycosyl transferase [bacterium]
MAIPKILHQVWLGPKEMPAQFVSWREQWRRLHPDWEYMLHTDKDIPQE